MKIFGFDITRARDNAFQEDGGSLSVSNQHQGSSYLENLPSFANELAKFSPEEKKVAIAKAVAEWEWTRINLVSSFRIAPPQIDPFLLAALFDSNGYHTNAVYLKRDAVVGQGFTCSDQLMELIQHPNADDTFQDLLEKTQLDFELYGSLYVEVETENMKDWSIFHSPALVTRVRPPMDVHSAQAEDFIQFVYGFINGWHTLQAVPISKFYEGMRGGIRQLKLNSPTGDRWYGKPEYISSKKLISLNFSIASLAEKWFDNAMVLDKLFTIEGAKLNEKQKADLSTFMRKSLTGLQNASKSLLLELQRGAKLDVKDMNANVQTSAFADFRKENRDEIASAHRVPPRLLGIIPAGQLGSTGEVEGQLTVFKIFFADARQRKVERFWQRLFKDMGLPDWNTFKLNAVDVSGGVITGRDMKDLVGAGVISPEEAQAEWFTEKGHFTAKGANAFTSMLSMIQKGVDAL